MLVQKAGITVRAEEGGMGSRQCSPSAYVYLGMTKRNIHDTDTRTPSDSALQASGLLEQIGSDAAVSSKCLNSTVIRAPAQQAVCRTRTQL
jgi:hypothetical protein